MGSSEAGQPAPEHLFAVVQKQEWGMLLQRLDHNPITLGKTQIQNQAHLHDHRARAVHRHSRSGHIGLPG